MKTGIKLHRFQLHFYCILFWLYIFGRCLHSRAHFSQLTTAPEINEEYYLKRVCDSFDSNCARTIAIKWWSHLNRHSIYIVHSYIQCRFKGIWRPQVLIFFENTFFVKDENLINKKTNYIKLENFELKNFFGLGRFWWNYRKLIKIFYFIHNISNSNSKTIFK